MSKDWINNLEKTLPPSADHTIKDADHALHDLALHIHLSHWHPISTAPCNQDVELRIVDEGKIVTLQFPCRLLNAGEWMNADLGTRIQIEPVEWRIWQHRKSPQPHSSPTQINV